MARTLALTTPYERGNDVLKLQQELNVRLAVRDLPQITADGWYGQATQAAVERVRYLLGYPANRLHAAVEPVELRWFKDPTTRPHAYRAVSLERIRKLTRQQRAIAAGLHGPDKAIAYARQFVGTHETGVSNWGGHVADWLKAVDCGPAPWCGAFAHACLAAAGVQGLSWRMRFVPYIVADARAGANGLVRLVPFEQARPGDLICFDWNRDGEQDHVALYLGDGVTIEGNTSRDPNAPPEQQSNGGEVCVRRRGTGSAALWSAVARPRYR